MRCLKAALCCALVLASQLVLAGQGMDVAPTEADSGLDGGLGGANPPVTEPEPLPDLAELLSIEGEYVQTERCLALHKLQQVKVLDESHIMFRLRGQRYFIAQMDRKCYGLEKDRTIAYDVRSGRLCALDRVRGIPPHGGATAACQLPRFQPVSKEQMVLLREALRTPHER